MNKTCLNIVSNINVKRLDKTYLRHLKCLAVLTTDLKIASANLTFQSERILRAGADELRTQLALT